MAMQYEKKIEGVTRAHATTAATVMCLSDRFEVQWQGRAYEHPLDYPVFNICFTEAGMIILNNILNGETHVYQIANDEIREIHFFTETFVAFDVKTGVLLLKKYTESGSLEYHGVRPETGQLLWESNDFLATLFFFHGDRVIRNQKAFLLSCHHVFDGSVQWSFSFADQGSWVDYSGKSKLVGISKYLGAYGDDLWVGLNNGKVLVLDIATGTSKGIFGDSSIGNAFPATPAMYMDAKHDAVIGLVGGTYWEVDARTFTSTVIDRTTEFRDAGITSFGDLLFDDRTIYFFDKDACKVGAFDRSSKQLRDQWTIPQNGDGAIFPMYMYLGKHSLYVIDSGNNLHVLRVAD